MEEEIFSFNFVLKIIAKFQFISYPLFLFHNEAKRWKEHFFAHNTINSNQFLIVVKLNNWISLLIWYFRQRPIINYVTFVIIKFQLSHTSKFSKTISECSYFPDWDIWIEIDCYRFIKEFLFWRPVLPLFRGCLKYWRWLFVW